MSFMPLCFSLFFSQCNWFAVNNYEDMTLEELDEFEDEEDERVMQMYRWAVPVLADARPWADPLVKPPLPLLRVGKMKKR